MKLRQSDTQKGKWSKITKDSILLLSIIVSTALCQQQIDGSSISTLQTSSMAMAEKLSESDQKSFMNALMIISYSIGVEHPEDKDLAEKKILEMVDKKTFKEIIEISANIKLDKKSLNDIKNAQGMGTSEEYQDDADIFRLRHLKYMAELIEEYFKKRGKYPLQGDVAMVNFVHIANTFQEEYAKKRPPFSHKLTPLHVFIDSLEAGLGRKVALRYDPQKVPANKPNFYIYLIQDDYYFFAVHLHNKFSFTKYIAPYYNKVEVTNLVQNSDGQMTLKELLANQEFVDNMEKKAQKEDFFIELEKESRPSTVTYQFSKEESTQKRHESPESKLVSAIKSGDISITKNIIKKNPKILEKESFDFLYLASRYGYTDICKYLIDNGVDVNGISKQAKPLAGALFEKHEETGLLLIKHNADIYDIFRGQSALHIAAQKGLKKVVIELLKNGIDINLLSENQFGVTPLQDASMEGQVEIVKLLISKGADVNRKSKLGFTPLDDALQKKHTDILNLLKKNGAKTNKH